MDLNQEKIINTEKENQIQQLINQINAQNQITEQLQDQLQVQKSLIEAKNQELITNQQLSTQEKQALQQEIHQLTNAFQQKEQEYQATIQQKDQKNHQLNQIINEQAAEINRLSEELEQQIDKWVQQDLHIQALEGTIKTLENTSGKYLEENAELRHEINVLKERLKVEQKNHKATEVILKDKEGNLTLKTQEFKKIDKMIKDQTTSYSAAIQPLKNRFKEDIKQRVEKATSWFKKWF
ncbi:MAG: ATPase [Candidatus Phytoplasma australasiaticum]|nr:ATPase [Candidatus Phytoplasma australasiaticum]